MEKQPQLTPASEFRAMREKGVPIPLVSVPNARLRALDAGHLLPLHKELPNILTDFVLKMFNHGLTTEDFDAFLAPRESVEETIEVMKSLEIVCQKGFVYPRITDEGVGEDEIIIEDVSPYDRALAFRLIFLPANVLREIRIDEDVEVATPASQGTDAATPGEGEAA